MVKFITIKCPNCGANIEINTTLSNSVCKYCSSTIILEDVLKDFVKDSEKINNIKKFIEIKEFENALILISEMLQENPLDIFALIYQVKIMVYLFDFENFNSKSVDFLDENWRTLKLILKNYDRVCKINNGVPEDFEDINDKIEMLRKWNDLSNEEDDICSKISEKLNLIWNSYKGDKNSLLKYLKNKIGLVSSGRTIAKLNMMKTSQSYEEENFDEPFSCFIGDRFLQKFEYKRDFSVEVTYDTNKDESFAVEYYGKITKFTDLKMLSIALDEIISEINKK